MGWIHRSGESRASLEPPKGSRRLAGDTVRKETGPRMEDRYDRLLLYTYTEGGDSIDAALIREGFGKAWTRDGQHRDYLVALQATAQAAGIGCLSEGAPPTGSPVEFH